MLPLSLGWIQYITIFIVNMAGGSEEAEIITIPDDPNDDWPSGGPQNLREAEAYMEKVNQIFEDLGELLHEDKDVLPSTICKLKKHMEHHWEQMKSADVDSGQSNKRSGLPPSQAAFDPWRHGSPGACHRSAHQLGVPVTAP